MCVVCRKLIPREGMIKLIKTKDGAVSMTKEKRQGGKGIYICRDNNCLEEFLQKKKFRKNFLERIDKDTLKILTPEGSQKVFEAGLRKVSGQI